VPNGHFPGDFDPTHFDQLGVIEVIVLRCRAKPGDDSGPESLTHESILGEIDNFGRPREDATAPGDGAGNNLPAVADAREEGAELGGFGGIFDGAADHPYQFGLDGEAPPPGYWTYHPQPPPRNDYRPENRPERRVHFDCGSLGKPGYSPSPPPQQRIGSQNGDYRGGPGGNGPLNSQSRAPVGYGGQPTWRSPRPIPTYSERQGPHWGMPTDAPRTYSNTAPNKYSDYDVLQPYMLLPPPPIPPLAHPAAWTAPGYSGLDHPGWNPTLSAGYPVFTPQPQLPLGLSYPTAPAAYPPWYPVSHGLQGPGYMVNYPVPAGGCPGNQAGLSGGLDPAKEENSNQNDYGNQGDNNGRGNAPNNNNNDGNTGNDDNGNPTGWGNDGNNGQPSGDKASTGWGHEQQENQQQDQTVANSQDWQHDVNHNNNVQEQQTDEASGENGQTNDQQASNNGGWGDNNQTQGNWDNSNQNNQVQGNWDNSANDNSQPQQPAPGWNSQPAMSAVQPSNRSTRPLYGPYGAYYSAARPRGTLSPTAEAEEEPPFDVPETIAADKGTTHQVQPGKGYLYLHKRASPEYIDSIEEPYARFVFKYRTKGTCKTSVGYGLLLQTKASMLRTWARNAAIEYVSISMHVLMMQQSRLSARSAS
jgi:hypothetical protein